MGSSPSTGDSLCGSLVLTQDSSRSSEAYDNLDSKSDDEISSSRSNFMKILILEDWDSRIQKFREKFIGCELFITDVPEQANEWLEKEKFDIIFLDHDLAQIHYDADTVCNETTGLCTAEFLGSNPHLQKDVTIIVHSLNPDGRKRMMDALGERVKHQIPFTNLFERLIVNKNI